MSPSPLLTDDERCLNIHALDKEINAFNTRKGYVMGMIDVEKNSYNTSERLLKSLKLNNSAWRTLCRPWREKNEQLIVNNSFAALNTANNDAEDVTQPQPKIKPIFMKITPDYNLLLQEIHRTHPTAKNTHMKGYFKIESGNRGSP
ncbi:uncharacterized protein TNCV_1447801 [Trichonephila clavipes]|nr:uncharacterized protein TNCV_1447801 [Trichonephila clavipes]